MNDNVWSIYRIPDVASSEYKQLIKRFPKPTDFQGKAKVFKSSMDKPKESTTVAIKYNDAGEPMMTIADIAAEIEAYLIGNDVRCVLLDKGLAGQLYTLLVPPEVDRP